MNLDAGARCFVKIKDRQGFNKVFGAESFLQHWPELETSGVEVKEVNEWFYIVNPITGRADNDTAFFTKGDMQHLVLFNKKIVDEADLHKRAIAQWLSKPYPYGGACGCLGADEGMPDCPCGMRWIEQVDGRWFKIDEHRSPITGVTHTAAECFVKNYEPPVIMALEWTPTGVLGRCARVRSDSKDPLSIKKRVSWIIQDALDTDKYVGWVRNKDWVATESDFAKWKKVASGSLLEAKQACDRTLKAKGYTLVGDTNES